MMSPIRKTTFTNLPNDVLKYILLLVAMSSGGAKQIAKFRAVSKGLKGLASSKEVLRAIKFEREFPSCESFWNTRGLIIKSARARNMDSYREIMKRIKEKVNPGHVRADETIAMMEGYNIVKTGGVDESSMIEEIRCVKWQVGRMMRRTNLDVLRAKSMIDTLGRRYFRKQKLLVRYECLKAKHEKSVAAFSLLEESAEC